MRWSRCAARKTRFVRWQTPPSSRSWRRSEPAARWRAGVTCHAPPGMLLPAACSKPQRVAMKRHVGTGATGEYGVAGAGYQTNGVAKFIPQPLQVERPVEDPRMRALDQQVPFELRYRSDNNPWSSSRGARQVHASECEAMQHAHSESLQGLDGGPYIYCVAPKPVGFGHLGAGTALRCILCTQRCCTTGGQHERP